VKSLENTCDT